MSESNLSFSSPSEPEPEEKRHVSCQATTHRDIMYTQHNTFKHRRALFKRFPLNGSSHLKARLSNIFNECQICKMAQLGTKLFEVSPPIQSSVKIEMLLSLTLIVPLWIHFIKILLLLSVLVLMSCV